MIDFEHRLRFFLFFFKSILLLFLFFKLLFVCFFPISLFSMVLSENVAPMSLLSLERSMIEKTNTAIAASI